MGLVGYNVLYYLYQRWYKFNMKVKLNDSKRVLGMFVVFYLVYQRFLLRDEYANKSYVDLNPILDIDEDFLYENEAFRAMIKKVALQYPQLTSPNFDLSNITNEPNKFYD